MADHRIIESLCLAEAGGLWRVRGVSGTTYVVDADAGLALRQPADNASTGPYDGCWMSLVSVRGTFGRGVVTLGQRHRWDFDPRPGEPGYTIWWIQTSVELIERLDPSERPAGRTAPPDEDFTPFRRA
jgi:hypothetical protein